MKTCTSAILATLAISMAASAAPRLVVSTPSLVPESEIDLVLDSPVIATSELGKTVDNTWLEIQPPLPGKLTWKAQNIARFIPSQSPGIGTTYTFSIPKERKHLDLSEVPAGKFATLSSENFQVSTAHQPNRWESGYSPSLSQWLIAFNDSVDTTTAGPSVYFQSSQGLRVPAKLEKASVETAGYYARYKNWASRFPGNLTTPPAPGTEIPNILIASPSSPLQPDANWGIVIAKGLPNAGASALLASDIRHEIGKIENFAVTNIYPQVMVDQPRKVVIRFNQPVPETLPADFLERCVVISPRPENLSATLKDNEIHLGNLPETAKYTVSFRGPFLSRAGLHLAEPFTKEIKFEHLDPELVLPSNNEAQFANGSRVYRIQTINLSSLTLRVKKLGGIDLIRAYQGYRNYTGLGHDGRSIEPTASLPYSLVGGTTIVEKEIRLENAVDTSREIVLSWDDLLPKDLRTAGLFLDITGEPNPASGATGRRNTQSIIQLTDIGLAWKLTGTESVIHAFSCQTGAPLPGVNLQIFGEDATTLQSAVTDASGIAMIPSTDADRHLHASLGSDGFLTAFDSTMNTVGLWHFPIRYSYLKSSGPVRRAFLFTDRSLYRPGETVRLKGIIRDQNGNLIQQAKPGPARIIILDPTDKEIHSASVTVSPAGSFDLSYALPGGKTGLHAIRLEYPEEIALAAGLEDDWEKRQTILESARFEIPLRVEEFRRNAFEITQTIPAVPPGATSVSADLLVKYYQGQPVAAGKVKHFSRVTNRNPYPERFRDFLFGDHKRQDWTYWYHYFGYRFDDEGDADGFQATQIQGEMQLSADGHAIISTAIPQAEFPSSRELTISSEVTDANNQTLTATTSALVHPASAYIGISRIDTLVRAGENLPLKIVATDTDGAPFPGALKVTATLTRQVNSAVKTWNDSGATTTRNDTTEETVITTELSLDPTASTAGGTDLTVTPKSTGLHFLTVAGTDPEGRLFATVTRFHVYGTREYPWLYEDGMRVKTVAEKKSYKPGETARILVLSPIEGTALVTVEREKVLRSFSVQLKADNPVIEVPLTDEDAPNAYVSVLIIKGANESAREHKEPQLRLGYCELIVENRRDKLALAFEPMADSYRPGEEITVSGSVTLADGTPASGAEITLYAEDEGTLAVMGYETPRPLDYFYNPRVLEVDTGTSFETFIPEDPGSQYFSNKGFFVGGGGELDQLADLLRKNFDPCAAWAPALVADPAGKFSYTFTVPDTLTRYRLIALAHHDTARFGHAESSVLVKKELMLEPKTPRFANQSDTFDARVLVQNASSDGGVWEVTLNTGNGPETPCVSPLGPVSEKVTLAPGASATLVFPVRADHTGEAVLRWRAVPVSLSNGDLTPALARKLSDAVETRFQIHYPMPLLRQTKLVSLKKGGKQDLREQMTKALLEGTGEIELGFSRSPLVEAAGSVDYLLQYPYGCVEQTTSSLMPWLAVEDLKATLPRFANLPEKKVAAAIQAGADRLLSMQLPDGSFSYWPGSIHPAPWATAYAGMGLMMASEKGASVPASALASLTGNLTESLRGIATEKSPEALERHTRSLLVLAMAGAPQTAYRNVLLDRVGELTPGARCLLATAIAMEEEGNPANLAAARSLLTSKTPFQSGDDSWMPWDADAAYSVLAWLAVDPDGPEPLKALERMLGDRNPYGEWRTTWVNGWSLIAMAEYAKNENRGDGPVNLTLGTGDTSEKISLTGDHPVATRSFKLASTLDLSLTNDLPAYVRVKIAAKPQIEPIQPVAKNGLSVERFYEKVNPDGSAVTLVEPTPGDLIRVSLRVTLPNDNNRYLVIDDPLPSLFETVNTDFKSQRAASGIQTSENDWQVSHSELRTDRATFFLDHVWRRGTYTVTYLARCTIAGEATAPPAKVESMYDPENFALSASRVFLAR